MRLRLSWPPSQLNPNSRLHWSRKASYTRSYKAIWASEVIQSYRGAVREGSTISTIKGKTEFQIEFAPPDRRPRDVDNAIASSKALIDALSLCSGVDDSKFKITYPREFLPPVKGGAVFIEVLG